MYFRWSILYILYIYIYIYIIYYGDVICHIPAKAHGFSGNILFPSLMDELDSVQYAADLTITGTWRGTSLLYTELGWESLSSRSWSRCLTLFYKMINNLTPECTRDPIPESQPAHYSLRNQDVNARVRARTENSSLASTPIAYLNGIN